MRITLTLDDKLVKKVREIAVERGTTLTELVRDYLESLAAEHENLENKRREIEALEESFKSFQIQMGKKTWRREDLHDRPSRYRSGQ